MSIGIGLGHSPVFFQRLLGGWTPFKPTSDGGLLPHTWYYAGQAAIYQDAAMTIPATADGDVVGGMPNQGSDVYSIIQAVTANKPTLRLNVQGGKPVLRFDGTDYLQGAFGGGAISQPITVFAVAQLNTGAVNDDSFRDIMDGDDNVNRVSLFKDRNTAPDEFGIFGGVVLDGNAANDNWLIWSALYNGVSSQFWHNGVSQALGNSGANQLDGLTVGAAWNMASQWIGDIAEILIYTANLSNADKNQLGQYLDAKYNITYTDI